MREQNGREANSGSGRRPFLKTVGVSMLGLGAAGASATQAAAGPSIEHHNPNDSWSASASDSYQGVNARSITRSDVYYHGWNSFTHRYDFTVATGMSTAADSNGDAYNDIATGQVQYDWTVASTSTVDPDPAGHDHVFGYTPTTNPDDALDEGQWVLEHAAGALAGWLGFGWIWTGTTLVGNLLEEFFDDSDSGGTYYATFPFSQWAGWRRPQSHWYNTFTLSIEPGYQKDIYVSSVNHGHNCTPWTYHRVTLGVTSGGTQFSSHSLQDTS